MSRAGSIEPERVPATRTEAVQPGDGLPHANWKSLPLPRLR